MKLESSVTFYKSKEDENTHVLDENTTANTRGRSARAHARLCKFTSGSRPSSSRRPILRSLICISVRKRYEKLKIKLRFSRLVI